MKRASFIEQILRDVYGEQPSADASITKGLVNSYINEGIGLAVKQANKDSIQFEGVSFINNSFYTTFKNLAVTKDENFTYKVSLPEIPYGIGKNEGISTLQFKDANNNLSLPCIPLSANQRGYYDGMRVIPNKTLYYSEGKFIYAVSNILLNTYTASVVMISGGDSADLTSELNVPADYLVYVRDFVAKILNKERQTPTDKNNDGISAV